MVLAELLMLETERWLVFELVADLNRLTFFPLSTIKTPQIFGINWSTKVAVKAYSIATVLRIHAMNGFKGLMTKKTGIITTLRKIRL